MRAIASLRRRGGAGPSSAKRRRWRRRLSWLAGARGPRKVSRSLLPSRFVCAAPVLNQRRFESRLGALARGSALPMLKVKLLHPDAKLPTVTYAGSDLGYDLYSIEDVI